ncbi:hypothetical protein LJC49_00950 [Ruminococcaceae bacterium OttesenSCG-928-I18]|nr:hypothetical protein [Ruminococcaceae bacterium OttesenSCG-928-I18]
MMPVQALSSSESAFRLFVEDVNTTKDFKELLQKVDAYLESLKKTEEEKRKEQEEELEERAKNKRLMDLRMRIATLQTKVAMGNENAQAELSAAKNELFLMLLFG